MFVDKDAHLISFGEIDTTKKVYLTFSGQHFSLFDRNILIYHKKKIDIVPLKHLGEGMGTFFAFERKKGNELMIDQQAIADGFFVHQFFDENLGHFISPVSREIQTKYSFSYQHFDWKVVEPRLMNAIITKNSTYLLSFLVGSSLSMGQAVILKDCLTNVKIFLPLTGNLAGKEKMLEDIFLILHQRGIFFIPSLLQEKFGSLYQISINDPEFLFLYANVIKPLENILQISTLEKQKNFVEQIKTFLEVDRQSEKTFFDNLLTTHVVKYWEKK